AGVTPIIGIEAYVAPESRRNKRKVQWGQPHQHVTPESVRQLKEILTAHPGPTEVRLRVRRRATTTVYRLGHGVAVTPEFWADLKAAVVVTRRPPIPNRPARPGARLHLGTNGTERN
ncbi:hypothetical protein ACFXOY_11415, partial [Streptomyces niveus]|uniref:hypothetical protein n=1 Tax=Streptomyces niveus TaxID=193462 RepID=UPI0036B78974